MTVRRRMICSRLAQVRLKFKRGVCSQVFPMDASVGVLLLVNPGHDSDLYTTQGKDSEAERAKTVQLHAATQDY